MYLRYRGVWFVRARGAHAFVLVVDFRRSTQSLFERPRDPRSLRGDPRFGALVQTIWSELAVAD